MFSWFFYWLCPVALSGKGEHIPEGTALHDNTSGHENKAQASLEPHNVQNLPECLGPLVSSQCWTHLRCHVQAYNAPFQSAISPLASEPHYLQPAHGQG